jgi:hypothetical protein
MSLPAFSMLAKLTTAGIGTMARALSPQPSQANKPKSTADFEAMLKLAGEGKVSSEQGVQISGRAGVELTPEQLARVAQAADRAEAAGFSTALVLIDGKALKLDVQTRQIQGTFDAQTSARTAQFDGVVTAPAEGEADAPQVLPMPGGLSAGGGGNASLAAVLDRVARQSRQTGSNAVR